MHFIAGQQWAGQREQRNLQVCTSVHTGQKKRREIAIFHNGDLTADVSTQSSTYIKNSTIEEKFWY